MIAQPSKRFIAYLLDGVASTLLTSLIMGLMTIPLIFTEIIDISDNIIKPLLTSAYLGYLLLLLICPIIIQAYFWSKGTSIGKMLLGLRVVDQVTHEPIGFFKMLLRETILKYISGFVFGLGYFWLFFNEERQTWHDKLLHTLVVQKI